MKHIGFCLHSKSLQYLVLHTEYNNYKNSDNNTKVHQEWVFVKNPMRLDTLITVIITVKIIISTIKTI